MLDFHQSLQVFARKYQYKQYVLRCESILVTTCGCVTQPHVHFIRLTYQYNHSTKYPYFQSHYIDYTCDNVQEAIQAIDHFHGDGLMDIVMMSQL